MVTIIVKLIKPKTKKKIKLVSKNSISMLQYGKGFHDGYAAGKHNAVSEAKNVVLSFYANNGDDMWI